MGDGGSAARLGGMKALLGLAAGAGASYGIYKLLSGGNENNTKRRRADSAGGVRRSQSAELNIQPGSLLAKVSGLEVVSGRGEDAERRRGAAADGPSGDLEPQHLQMLLWRLQASGDPAERSQILVTLGNAAAFTVQQNRIRELGGIHIIAGFLTDPAPEVRVQTLNALNNLSMNMENQEQLTVHMSRVLELIEISPVNSDLQLGALRLLTNFSVADKHQHLLKASITLLLSLLVVSNEAQQVQALKVLVNLSSNPDMMDDIVQAQAPASVLLLFDARTAPPVLLRLLTFAGNLKSWRPSAQVAAELRQQQDSLFRVLLDESSPLHGRLLQLLSHPDEEVRAQVAHVLT